MGEFDPEFINPIEQRPKLTKIEDDGIPIIDLSSIASLKNLPISYSEVNDPNIYALVAEIRDASEKWGFFKVVNHGIPHETVAKLHDVVEKFFGQPKEEKRKINRNKTNPLGYFDDERSDNVRDWKEGFDYAVQDSALALVFPDDGPNAIQLRNRWPEYPPQFRNVVQEYAKEVQKMGLKVLEAIALGLGLAANRLTDFYKDPAMFMRFNHYTPCPCPDLALGIGAHKDTGGLTILWEDDVGGLQIRRKSDGEWVFVKPVPGAFVVNIADTLQVWSNDKYESVEHRVMLNPEKDRFSVAFNFGPAYNVNVKPLVEMVDEQNPAKYKEYNYGAFRASVMRGNIMKPNRSLQISDFKIIQ